ncbi:hypothetical protein DRB96_29635 [Streptomyces sp. ICC1]|nr:hypothetical protein DRB89_29065 [Streptomyces sp. ICC4]AWZ15726.1 hypothetical protein DRB96_29635 [Streptomyces sp. ICC1]
MDRPFGSGRAPDPPGGIESCQPKEVVNGFRCRSQWDHANIRLGTPVLADLGYVGAGGTFAVPRRRPPRPDLTTGQRSLNRAHARLRYPVERGIARLKTWKIFLRARCSPNWLTQAAKAILTLESYR